MFDADRQPHGRGTLQLGKRARYEGRLEHGVRSGLGTLYVMESTDGEESADESSESENDAPDRSSLGEQSAAPTSALRVIWADDQPHGPGSFTEPDGGRLVGVWAEGELSGLAREEHPDGMLRFLGHYRGGVRHGEGVEVRLDGGALAGTWVDGALHGPHCAYLYPCSLEGTALVGEWREGELYRAHRAALGSRTALCCSGAAAHRLPTTATNPALVGLLAAVGDGGGLVRTLRDLSGRRDPRSAGYTLRRDGEGIAPGTAAALQPEPYELARVAVRRSTLCGAGEGLFASRDRKSVV